MLVISRFVNESIYIGDDIVVTVTAVRGDKVRIGIQAASNVPINRKEVRDRIVESGKSLPSISDALDASASGSGT